jgi:hypothetical protein
VIIYHGRVLDGSASVYNVRNTLRQGEFSKILRIEIEIYPIIMTMGMYNQTSMDIDLINTNLLEEI